VPYRREGGRGKVISWGELERLLEARCSDLRGRSLAFNDFREETKAQLRDASESGEAAGN